MISYKQQREKTFHPIQEDAPGMLHIGDNVTDISLFIAPRIDDTYENMLTGYMLLDKVKRSSLTDEEKEVHRVDLHKIRCALAACGTTLERIGRRKRKIEEPSNENS